MSEIDTIIRTPYATREHQFQRALDRLKRKVQAYISLPFPERGSPRAEIDGFIFEAMEEIEYARDDRSPLYLAVEDLTLLQKQPDALDVSPDDDDPPWAEYLICQNFEAWINDQLGQYADTHPLCCEVCGRETAAWLWFPFIYGAHPDLDLRQLPPSCRWGIGETCKATLLSQGYLHFWQDSTHQQMAESTCLVQLDPLPLDQPPPLAGRETVIGSLPPGYQTLAQRLHIAHQLFDGWLAHTAASSKEHTNERDIEWAIEKITQMVVPTTWREPLPLLLLALEEPMLADMRPDDYAALIEAHEDEHGVTAAYLLWVAVQGMVSAALIHHWQKYAAPSVS